MNPTRPTMLHCLLVHLYIVPECGVIDRRLWQHGFDGLLVLRATCSDSVPIVTSCALCKWTNRPNELTTRHIQLGRFIKTLKSRSAGLSILSPSLLWLLGPCTAILHYNHSPTGSTTKYRRWLIVNKIWVTWLALLLNLPFSCAPWSRAHSSPLFTVLTRRLSRVWNGSMFQNMRCHPPTVAPLCGPFSHFPSTCHRHWPNTTSMPSCSCSLSALSHIVDHFFELTLQQIIICGFNFVFIRTLIIQRFLIFWYQRGLEIRCLLIGGKKMSLACLLQGYVIKAIDHTEPNVDRSFNLIATCFDRFAFL